MPLGDPFWVAMRATFPCRACGFPSPLEGVELDQAVHCAQCGSLQRFDKSGWAKGLPFAHEVGDLAGPSIQGRFPNPRIFIGDDNPHRSIGKTLTFVDKDVGPFRVEATPGHPTCKRCRVPLQTRFEGNAVHTQCPACSEQARYEVPAETRHYAQAIRAVVAPEQRVDRERVRIQASERGLGALNCPKCGAAIQPGEGETVTCQYCRAVALLPARARSRSDGQIAGPTIFWVMFQGPSERRIELETPTAPSALEGAIKKTVGVFKRGLTPLPGIELAPQRPGLDGRQLGLTAALSALALAVGGGLVVLYILLS